MYESLWLLLAKEKMIPKNFFNIVIALVVFFPNYAQAQKVYMTLADTSTEYKILITIIQKPCDKKDGNATGLTKNRLVMGCWTLEGEDAKIKWFDIEQTNSYPMIDFKLVTEIQSIGN